MPPSPPIYEGVFAIHKPYGITSAAVIRDVQAQFNNSELFEPWMEREKRNRQMETHNQRQKRNQRFRAVESVKMGHGGTLDPLATGILILGVGAGTKSLNQFLGCTKEYEAVVLFGAATDTYDMEGKVVGRKAFEHVSKDKVEEALAKFRGEIMQKPPIYSALKVNGKRLLDYAREGIEVPAEIKPRPMRVLELELVEWMDGGSHEHRWPEREADKGEKEILDRVLRLDRDRTPDREEDEPPAKRRRTSNDSTKSVVETKSRPTEPADGSADAGTREPCPAPACRIRMTVTSGFYVRSFSHDLGAEVGSLALMSSLVRSRQGDFALNGDTTLPYEDLDKGEDVWGPKVKSMLEGWQGKDGASRQDEASSKETPGNDNSAKSERNPKSVHPRRRRRNSSSSESS